MADARWEEYKIGGFLQTTGPMGYGLTGVVLPFSFLLFEVGMIVGTREI